MPLIRPTPLPGGTHLPLLGSPLLLAWLEQPEADRRRIAARRLASFPGLSHALASRLRVEVDGQVREALLTALAEIGDEGAVVGLVRLLRSGDARLRNGAVEALQQLPEGFARHRATLLSDRDPQVRQRAVEVMRDLAHPGVPDWLEELLFAEPDPNVCVAALDVLGEIGQRGQDRCLKGVARRFAAEPMVILAVKDARRRLGEWL